MGLSMKKKEKEGKDKLVELNCALCYLFIGICLKILSHLPKSHSAAT